MTERSAEDVLAGVLRIPIGKGIEKLVPTLPIAEVRKWQRIVTAEVPTLEAAVAPDGSVENMPDFIDESLDKVLDMVVAYDLTGALGGREWLEANADPEQIYAAARMMGEAAFPFVSDLRVLRVVLEAIVAARGDASSEPSSTNGHSPSGASTQEPSKPASTRSS